MSTEVQIQGGINTSHMTMVRIGTETETEVRLPMMGMVIPTTPDQMVTVDGITIPEPAIILAERDIENQILDMHDTTNKDKSMMTMYFQITA